MRDKTKVEGRVKSSSLSLSISEEICRSKLHYSQLTHKSFSLLELTMCSVFVSQLFPFSFSLYCRAERYILQTPHCCNL